MEGEALAVQPRSHQRQQQRGWTGERRNADAVAMRGADEECTGVGDGRAARLRHQAEILAPKQRRKQRLEIFRAWRGRELPDVQFAHRQRVFEALQFRACGFRVLDDEVAEPAGQLADPGGVGECPIAFAQACRYEKQGPAMSVGVHGSWIPSLRSIDDRAIRGKPMSAFGSSPRSASSKVIPKPSTLALPAQSSGSSRRT